MDTIQRSERERTTVHAWTTDRRMVTVGIEPGTGLSTVSQVPKRHVGRYMAYMHGR